MYIGFTATKANLLSVPVYAWGCLMTLVVGVYADRLNKRCLVNVYAFLLWSIFFELMTPQMFVWCRIGWVHYPYLLKDASAIIFCRLPCCFVSPELPDPDHLEHSMSVCGCRAIYPTIRKPYSRTFLLHPRLYSIRPANSVAWVAGNVEGSYKRSVTLGMAIGFGNLNGAVTSNIVSFFPVLYV